MRAQVSGMMILLFFALLLCGSSGSLGSETAKAADPKKESVTSQTQWKQKMQGLYQSLSALLTDVCSDQRYYDPKNSTRIEREIKSISGFAHEVSKKSTESLQSDPTLPLFSGFLAQETSEAARSFRDGNLSYAREILRSLPGDCLACHSRNSLGPDFATLPLKPDAPLKPWEQGEFYAATRQFDLAVETFQKVIRGSEKETPNPWDYEKTVNEALSIAVRFKRDPALAKSIVQSVLDKKDAPQFLKEDAAHWKKSLEDWEKEPKGEFKTEAGLHAEAVRLIALAKEGQAYSMDHSQDMIFLRASTILYDLVQKYPNGDFVADSLLMLGMCYEIVAPSHLENMHNIYYEACIERAPHTEVARTCYRRYERSTYLGFTGSSGTHLPQEVKNKLLKLWSTAMKNDGKI